MGFLEIPLPFLNKYSRGFLIITGNSKVFLRFPGDSWGFFEILGILGESWGFSGILGDSGGFKTVR